MPVVIQTIDELVELIGRTPLLSKEQLLKLRTEIAPKYTDPLELGRQLVKLEWISVYQGRKFLSGRLQELLFRKYLIIEKIGQGGMGKVYKARQLDSGRLVALKVIRPSLLSNETALKRFEREAQAAGQLTHPNIVRLYEADQDDNRYYMALELVEGVDLSHWVRENGPLPLPLACDFIRQAALGLQHAHEKGVVHRDIKPSNLLIEVTKPRNPSHPLAGGVVKLLDMGLARVQGLEEEEPGTALTHVGTVIGTPDFMSPEQAKNSSNVDHRADLYSLGCTFYFILSGSAPFTGAGSVVEKLLQHQMDQPKSIQEIRNDVPAEVAAILHQLLAKAPFQRPQHGGMVAQALYPWINATFTPSNFAATIIQPAFNYASLSTETPANQHTIPSPSHSHPGQFNSGSSAILNFDDPSDAENTRNRTTRPRLVSRTRKVIPKREYPRWLLPAIGAGLIAILTFLLLVLLGSKLGNSSTSTNTDDEKKDANSASTKGVKEVIDLARVDRLLPDQTTMVARIDVKKLTQSSLYQKEIATTWKKNLEAFRTQSGIDLNTNLHRLWFFGEGKETFGCLIESTNTIPTPIRDWISTLETELIVLADGTSIEVSRTRNGASKPIYLSIRNLTNPIVLVTSSRSWMEEILNKSHGLAPSKIADSALAKNLSRIGSSKETAALLIGKEIQLDQQAKEPSPISSIFVEARLNDDLDLSITFEGEDVVSVDRYVKNLKNVGVTLLSVSKEWKEFAPTFRRWDLKPEVERASKPVRLRYLGLLDSDLLRSIFTQLDPNSFINRFQK